MKTLLPHNQSFLQEFSNLRLKDGLKEYGPSVLVLKLIGDLVIREILLATPGCDRKWNCL